MNDHTPNDSTFNDHALAANTADATHATATPPADAEAPPTHATATPPADAEAPPTHATVTAPVEDEDVPDYFAILRSLRAGEKMQLMRRLGVSEQDLAAIGTAQLLAVAWKARHTRTGRRKADDLLDLTDEQLLDLIGITSEQFTEQVQTAISEAQGPADEDDEGVEAPKSV